MMIFDGCEKKGGQRSENRAFMLFIIRSYAHAQPSAALIVYHDSQFILSLYGVCLNFPVYAEMKIVVKIAAPGRNVNRVAPRRRGYSHSIRTAI